MLAHPNIREQISWNTPFFYFFDHLCYFSIIKKTKGVEVCFVKGFHVSNESGFLDAKDRKLNIDKLISFFELDVTFFFFVRNRKQ
jgi:uncharacterized protein YdhG (YjbR/CyaY superfamily)